MAEDIDTVIDKMLTPSQGRIAQLGTAINGAGPEAAAAFKSLASLAQSQVDTARAVTANIQKLRSDETLPSGHRLTESIERVSAAKVMLSKLNSGAHAAHGQLEAALTKALLPGPHHDPAERLLIRDGLRTRYGHLEGEHLVAAVTKRIGQDPAHDGELLSSFGDDFFSGKSVNPDMVSAIRVQATEAYLKREDGTKQQQAARTGLSALRSLNIKGNLSAFSQGAQLHLSKLDGATPTPQPTPVGQTES